MRLQDGTDSSNGRVEICQDGIWGAVCSSGWDHTDAGVVCRQLGYGTEGTYVTCICIHVHTCTACHVHFASPDVAVTSVFGPGGSVLVSDVRCTGTEQNLHQCHKTGSSNYTCKRENSAGVICSRSFGKYRNMHEFMHKSLNNKN